MFHTSFPTIASGSMVSGSMPPAPGSAGGLAKPLADALLDSGLRPITVQDNGLTATTGADPGTLDAVARGIPVGYQELNAVYGAKNCTMARGLASDAGCDEQVLLDAINYGITQGGAQLLEFYPQDIYNYVD